MRLLNFTGTLTYIKFILKRDRLRIIIWLLVLIGMTCAVTVAFPNLYATSEDITAILNTLNNPAMVAMFGPIYGADNYHFGAILSSQMLLFSLLGIAVMCILLVTRHTRKDEELGRLEVLRSLPFGKDSTLGATFIVYSLVSLILGLSLAILLPLLNIEHVDVIGSINYGLALSVIGIYFVAITGLFAQLSQSSRGTLALSFGFLGFAYILRAYGDLSSEALSLISPLGLVLRVQAYVSNEWWPLIILLIQSIILMLIALILNHKRDLDSALLPTKAGRKQASKLLLSPFGLLFRLQRGSLFYWSIGIFVLGVSYGSILGDMEMFLESNELYRQLISNIGHTGDLVEAFTVMLIAIIAISASIPTIMSLHKLRQEEQQGRIEQIIGLSVSRFSLILSSLILAIVCSVWFTFIGTLGLWIAGDAVTESSLNFVSLLSSSFAYLPAITLFIGISTLLTAYLPKWTKVVWIYLTFAFITIYFGGILQLPQWVSKLTPLGFVPQMPVEEFNLVQTLLMTIIAFILIGLGVVRYQKRDMMF